MEPTVELTVMDGSDRTLTKLINLYCVISCEDAKDYNNDKMHVLIYTNFTLYCTCVNLWSLHVLLGFVLLLYK